jgi:hypothetical protein
VIASAYLSMPALDDHESDHGINRESGVAVTLGISRYAPACYRPLWLELEHGASTTNSDVYKCGFVLLENKGHV